MSVELILIMILQIVNILVVPCSSFAGGVVSSDCCCFHLKRKLRKNSLKREKNISNMDIEIKNKNDNI